uniref:Uncharacterized protein n=1 Tax=Anguilla anguilla TaxID=7936 RepID=A0A0E9SJX1_ANGAN
MKSSPTLASTALQRKRGSSALPRHCIRRVNNSVMVQKTNQTSFLPCFFI